MNVVTITELRALMRDLKIVELLGKCPFSVTSNGEEVAYFCRKDGVIVVDDLHPRVRNQLRAREQMARRGMPKNIRIESD